MNKEISTKIGKEISLNGYSLKVLYSALKNYIQRGIANKAIYSGIELDVFECVEGGERIFNDFIDTLKLFYLQYLGVSAIGIWKDLDRMFSLIEKSKTKGEKTKLVIDIVNTLAKNYHSLLSFYFNNIYLYKDNEKIKEYLDYFPTIKKIYMNIDEKSLNKNLNDYKVLKNIYYESLKNKDLDSFYWARLIDENPKIKIDDKNKIIFDTFTQVLEEEDKNDILSPIAKEWYSNFQKNENRYLTYFIPIIFLTIKTGYLGKIFEVEDWKKYVYINVSKPALKFDDFIFKNNDYILSDELSYNELRDFFLFTNELNKNIINEKYLKTYIDYSNLFPLTNYAMYNILINDEEYKSVEHYYQAMKFKNDIYMVNKIKNAKTSLDAKKLGENHIYEDKKEEILILNKALRSKFNQHPELIKMLINTKGKIIYNISDPFLGIGFENEGKNIVGKILEKIRNEKIQKEIPLGDLKDIPESVFYFINIPERINKSIRKADPNGHRPPFGEDKNYYAFDIDGTIVSPSNILLPNVKKTLEKIYNQGNNIVLISNQKRRKIGDIKLKQKLEKIATQLDIPFIAFCAREEDEYRKPNIGILSLVPKDFGEIKIFVGDAAGRKNDHSDDDLKFAENAGVKFQVPDKFFTI